MKKILIISILLFIISIGCVSASDVDSANIEPIGGDINTNFTGNFESLQSLIDDASEGSTINLNNNYTGSGEITIDKALTINGNYNYINALGESTIFKISADDAVVLNNILFFNGYSEENGGAINALGPLKLNNCYFENNVAENGGAVYSSDVITISNCEFNSNSAGRGGAVYLSERGFINNVAEIKNTIFVNNKASNYGGALYALRNLTITNTDFKDNKVNGSGGAIYTRNGRATYSTIYDRGAPAYTVANKLYYQLYIKGNCVFENNVAENDGGAIFVGANDYAIDDDLLGYLNIAKDVSFINNNASNAGAISIEYCEAFINGVDFTNNYANIGGGGAIAATGKSTLIIDKSNFNNNFAEEYGGSIFSVNQLNITNSNFKSSKEMDFINYYGHEDNEYEGCLYLKNNNMDGANSYDIWYEGVTPISSQVKLNFIDQTASKGDEINILSFEDDNGNTIRGYDIPIEIKNEKEKVVYDGALSFSDGYKYVCDLDDGVYSVTGELSSDVASNVKVKKATLTIGKKRNVVINAPDVTKNYGGSEKLEITLTEDNAPIANKNVLINLNGVNYTKATNANGKISMDTNFNSGTYNALISYDGFTKTSKITINKLTTSLTLTTSQSNDKTAALTATVSPSAASGNVVFNINNKDYTATISNGKAAVTVKDLDYKTYDVKATYAGSTNYKSSQASAKVTLEEKKLIIDAPDVTKYYGGSERLTVRISDSTGKALANKQVNININGQPYTRTTDSSGKTSIALNLNSGTYKVPVECDGVKVESTVTVKSTVSGNDITKMYRNDTQYYATFVDSEGNLLKNTKVKFNINGVFYERTTNDQGSAKMNINLNPKKYVITATNPSSGEQYTNVVTVNSLFTENYDLTKYYRNASAYSLRLLGPDGKPVKAGQSVVFNINGVFYTRNSNDDGYVKMNINLQPGTYTITAEYNGLRASNTIKVLNVLTGKDVNMEYKDGSKYEAKLLDGQGKPYAGQTIRLNINGVFYDRVTDANGIARLNLNLQPGTYIITASYNGLNAANNVVIRSAGLITHKSYGFTVEVPKDAKCEDAFVVNTGSCIVRYSNGQYAHISEHSDTYQSNVGFYMNYGRYLNTGSYGNWIILNNPSKSSTNEAYVLICNSNPVYAISSNDLSIAKQLAGSLKIVPGCVPDNADSGESGEIDEDMVEYDCGHFQVVLPQSATIELIKDEGNAAVFEVTYDGNTYQITEDSTYSKNSYLNIITSNGGSIIDTYGGWTLATINSQAYFAYCENSGITFGVMGNQRDIVESIASSMTF